MSNFSVSYHDYIDESNQIVLDTTCLDSEKPLGERKWIIRIEDFSIFLTQGRARVLRDLLNAALTAPLTQDEAERIEHGEDNIRDSMPDVDDGGVSDIEKQNDAVTARLDADEVAF